MAGPTVNDGLGEALGAGVASRIAWAARGLRRTCVRAGLYAADIGRMGADYPVLAQALVEANEDAEVLEAAAQDVLESAQPQLPGWCLVRAEALDRLADAVGGAHWHGKETR